MSYLILILSISIFFNNVFVGTFFFQFHPSTFHWKQDQKTEALAIQIIAKAKEHEK